IVCGERLAVVERDATAELESKLRPGLIPGPARREFGYDRVEAVQRLHGIESDKIVEHRHERHVRRDRRLLVDRGAWWLGGIVDGECTALFLRRGGAGTHRHKSAKHSSKPARLRHPMHSHALLLWAVLFLLGKCTLKGLLSKTLIHAPTTFVRAEFIDEP